MTVDDTHAADPVWGTWLEKIKNRYEQGRQFNKIDSARLVCEVYRLRAELWKVRGTPTCPVCGATKGLQVPPNAPPPHQPSVGTVFYVHCGKLFTGNAPDGYSHSEPYLIDGR